MNTKEMIEVLQAFERGEKIECKDKSLWGKWKTTSPVFNFGSFDYRIAKPEPKKVMYHACINRMSGCLTFELGVGDHFHDPKFWIRTPQFDIEVTE